MGPQGELLLSQLHGFEVVACSVEGRPVERLEVFARRRFSLQVKNASYISVRRRKPTGEARPIAFRSLRA